MFIELKIRVRFLNVGSIKNTNEKGDWMSLISVFLISFRTPTHICVFPHKHPHTYSDMRILNNWLESHSIHRQAFKKAIVSIYCQFNVCPLWIESLIEWDKVVGGLLAVGQLAEHVVGYRQFPPRVNLAINLNLSRMAVQMVEQ